MILAQVFKTLAGAQRRAAFETAHSRKFTYRPVLYYPEGAGGPVYYQLSRRTKWAEVNRPQIVLTFPTLSGNPVYGAPIAGIEK